MSNVLEEFRYRKSLIHNLEDEQAQPRLLGLYTWLQESPEASPLLQKLEADLTQIIEEAKLSNSKRITNFATTPERIAAVGLYFVLKVIEGDELWRLARSHNISPSNVSNIDEIARPLLIQFIYPVFEYIERELEILQQSKPGFKLTSYQNSSSNYPPVIHQSLTKFFEDHPDSKKTGFIMMQFGSTSLHESIVSGICSTLATYGLTALRADDKEYHEDLFSNVQTYLYGCGFGIAVFERLEDDDFNPNVSLEVGYMRALGKKVCLLKDRTLKTLQTDLVGKLYKSFDPQNPGQSIPPELQKWLEDNDIITY